MNRKNAAVDLRVTYQKTFEIPLIISLKQRGKPVKARMSIPIRFRPNK